MESGPVFAEDSVMQTTTMRPPERVTQGELRRVGVEMVSASAVLRCEKCGEQWTASTTKGGKWPQGYWRHECAGRRGIRWTTEEVACLYQARINLIPYQMIAGHLGRSAEECEAKWFEICARPTLTGEHLNTIADVIDWTQQESAIVIRGP